MGKTSLTLSTLSLGALVSWAQTQIPEERGLVSLLLLFFLTLQYYIGFAIHQHESATGVHKFPLLNPPHLPPHTIPLLKIFGCVTACGIPVPGPGVESAPSAVDMQSLNHWTTREVYFISFFLKLHALGGKVLNGYLMELTHRSSSWAKPTPRVHTSWGSGNRNTTNLVMWWRAPGLQSQRTGPGMLRASVVAGQWVCNPKPQFFPLNNEILLCD